MSGTIDIWWRDDDAGRDSERLDALLALARRAGRPLSLAVVPAWLEPEVVAKIRASDVFVLQHGWAHADHAADGSRQIELGGTLGGTACRDQLTRGKAILEQAFGARFLPVLVPPWNRIDIWCLQIAAELGYTTVSTFAGDARAEAHGLAQVNCHVDLMDWEAGRRMKPPAALRAEIDRLVGDPALGTLGVMSHHLDMTPADLTALEQLFGDLDSLERCRWARPEALFPPRRKPADAATRRGS